MSDAALEERPDTGQSLRVLVQEIAAAVQAHRAERGLSVREIAEAAGMSQQALDRFLRRASKPNYTVESSTLERLAAAIGLTWKLEPTATEKGDRT